MKSFLHQKHGTGWSSLPRFFLGSVVLSHTHSVFTHMWILLTWSCSSSSDGSSSSSSSSSYSLPLSSSSSSLPTSLPDSSASDSRYSASRLRHKDDTDQSCTEAGLFGLNSSHYHSLHFLSLLLGYFWSEHSLHLLFLHLVVLFFLIVLSAVFFFILLLLLQNTSSFVKHQEFVKICS